MKNKKKATSSIKKNKWCLIAGFIFLACIAYLSVLLVSMGMYIEFRHRHDPDMYLKREASIEYINSHREGIKKILTEIMDRAELCQQGKDISSCQKDVSQEIFATLTDFEKLGGHEATYFIRLKGNASVIPGDYSDIRLQKLFLSGEFKSETPRTKGEKKVVDKLYAQRGRLEDQDNFNLEPIPAFFCVRAYRGVFCGDNPIADYGCLKEFLGEYEDIIIFHDEKNVYGAVVRLYGQ